MRYAPSEEMRRRLPLVAALERQGLTANEATEHLARRIVELEDEVVRLRMSVMDARLQILDVVKTEPASGGPGETSKANVDGVDEAPPIR